MKTLSLKIPEALDEKLGRMAERKRVSKSVLIREALAGYLDRDAAPPEGSFLARSLGLSECVEGPEDLSVNPDRMIGYGR